MGLERDLGDVEGKRTPITRNSQKSIGEGFSDRCILRSAILVVSMGLGRWHWRGALGTIQGKNNLVRQLIGLASISPFSFILCMSLLKVCEFK